MSSKVESLVVIKKEEEREHAHAAVFLPSKTSPEVAKDNADQKDMEPTIAFLEAEILRKNKTSSTWETSSRQETMRLSG